LAVAEQMFQTIRTVGKKPRTGNRMDSGPWEPSELFEDSERGATSPPSPDPHRGKWWRLPIRVLPEGPQSGRDIVKSAPMVLAFLAFLAFVAITAVRSGHWFDDIIAAVFLGLGLWLFVAVAYSVGRFFWRRRRE